MNIFVVIPAFNESERIVQVVNEITNKGYKVIVVDDGSTDRTYEKLSKIQNSKSKIQVIRHKVNLGKGAAMKTGATLAFNVGAEAVMFMDSDGQHDPLDLPKFVNKLKSGKYDVVLGIRKQARDVPFIRGFGNKVGIVVIFLLFGIRVSDLLCGYRALTRYAFKKISWESVGYGVETEMVAKTGVLGLKYCQVVVKTIYHDKVKGVTLLDAVKIMLDVIRWRIDF